MSQAKPVLLLEDDSFDVIVLQRSLAASKLQVDLHAVSNGEEALTALGLSQRKVQETLDPALVILDINVPRISGFEVCRQIRQSKHLQNIHVVFFSGSTSANDQEMAFDAGADYYFDKNHGPEGLISHLSNYLTVET